MSNKVIHITQKRGKDVLLQTRISNNQTQPLMCGALQIYMAQEMKKLCREKTERGHHIQSCTHKNVHGNIGLTHVHTHTS